MRRNRGIGGVDVVSRRIRAPAVGRDTGSARLTAYRVVACLLSLRRRRATQVRRLLREARLEPRDNKNAAGNRYSVFQKSDDQVWNLESPYQARANLITRKRASDAANST